MATISIIVPVYNVESYLRRCVDSILSQTFADFELILVDDGSQDNCPAICDEYASKDSRIRVIHQKNQGLSAARNAGLCYVLSESISSWVTFIDSDDWVHPQMLEMLYNAVLTNNTKIAIGNHQKTNNDVAFESYTDSNSKLWDVEAYYTSHNLNATTAWGKLYHKTCFEHIRYPVGKIHEDEFTTYKILFHFKSVAVVDLPLYIYYSNPQGITKSGKKLQWLHALSAFEEQLSFFKSIGANKAYSYRIANYYIELVLYPKQLSWAHPQERAAKLSLQHKRKAVFSQMSAHEKEIAYQYLYPRFTRLFQRIRKCIKLLKEGGISSILHVIKARK